MSLDASYMLMTLTLIFPSPVFFLNLKFLYQMAFCLLNLAVTMSISVLPHPRMSTWLPLLTHTHAHPQPPSLGHQHPPFLPIAPNNQLEETLTSFFFWSPVSINEQVQLSLPSKITQLLHTSLTNTTLVKVAMTLTWAVVMASHWPPCISAVIPFNGIWTIF